MKISIAQADKIYKIVSEVFNELRVFNSAAPQDEEMEKALELAQQKLLNELKIKLNLRLNK